jgi:hypothetical protein
MPLPDMSIEEFNVTPLGRAIYCIQTVLELIVED